jgi:hypothetical protein
VHCSKGTKPGFVQPEKVQNGVFWGCGITKPGFVQRGNVQNRDSLRDRSNDPRLGVFTVSGAPIHPVEGGAMTIRYHVIGAVAAILGITAPASAYTITSFNIPGSVYLGPVYIAGPGQLAGEYVSSNFVDAGFAATDGSISTFNAPGNEGTFVLGIDSAAQIAVQTDEDAFVYQNGGFKIVSPPQSTQTVIQGINNSGQLVGYYYLGDGGGSSGFTEQGGSELH